MSNVKDTIDYALEGNLADMTASLEAAIKDKVLGAIEAKKAEVAQSMFNPVAESVESRDLNGPSHGGVIAYTDTVGNPAIASHNHGHAIHRSINGDNFKHVWDDGENESSHDSLSGAIKSFEKATGKTVPKEHIDFFNKHDKHKTVAESVSHIHSWVNGSMHDLTGHGGEHHPVLFKKHKEGSITVGYSPGHDENDKNAVYFIDRFNKNGGHEEGKSFSSQKDVEKELTELGHSLPKEHSEKFRKDVTQARIIDSKGKIKESYDEDEYENEELNEGHSMHTHTVHFSSPESGEWKGKMLINADSDKEAVADAHDMAKKHGLKVMRVSKNNSVMVDKTIGEEVVYEAENSTDKPRIRVNNISHVYSTNDPKEVSKFPSPKPQSYSTNDPRAAKLLAKFKKTKSKKESPEKVLMGLKYGKAMPKNEDIEQVDEKLDPSMGAGEYIHDFVHSKNKKFSGKSKEERIKQALGAYYAAKRGK